MGTCSILMSSLPYSMAADMVPVTDKSLSCKSSTWLDHDLHRVRLWIGGHANRLHRVLQTEPMRDQFAQIHLATKNIVDSRVLYIYRRAVRAHQRLLVDADRRRID